MIGRRLLLAGSALAIARPAWATPDEVSRAIAAVIKGAPLQSGRVRLEIAEMVENGNAVGVSLRAEAPEGGRVASLHLFSEGNPLPGVFSARLGPMAMPRLDTRMRLATSAAVVGVAVMADGQAFADSVTVMVTLAACLE